MGINLRRPAATFDGTLHGSARRNWVKKAVRLQATGTHKKLYGGSQISLLFR
jgi:hypothetical protein